VACLQYFFITHPHHHQRQQQQQLNNAADDYDYDDDYDNHSTDAPQSQLESFRQVHHPPIRTASKQQLQKQ
jgi:hypothetical protein